MISLFCKFTSGSPEIRGWLPPGRDCFIYRVNQKPYICRHPLWVKYKNGEASGSSEAGSSSEASGSSTLTLARDVKAAGKAIYSMGPWLPFTANPNYLPFKIPERGRKTLRSPDRKKGLADVLRDGGRVKSFRLRDAIVYSYFRDMRFVLLICLLCGFSVWWYLVPSEVFANPGVLSSPDIGLIVRVARETFEKFILSVHHIPSPCDCGEPLNNTAKDLLEPKESFDPLGWKPNQYRCSVPVYVGAIVLSLALAESISLYGFRCIYEWLCFLSFQFLSFLFPGVLNFRIFS